MSYVDLSRPKATIQISILMLLFLVASSVANTFQERYTFVVLYLISFVLTLLNLIYYRDKADSHKMAQHVTLILFVLFFSFFFIGEQKTFDILWVLILPVVTIIITDYNQTRMWLGSFIVLLLLTIVLQSLFPQLIAYEGFALWSMLWAGIFFAGMVIYYKKVQQQMQEEIDQYQKALEEKVVKTEHEVDTLKTEKKEMDYLLMKSRLGSLETQLNPHFLFNALNSITELIHQNSEKAEEAMLKMSSFLRNTMSEKMLLSLAEELDNVSAYVDLENIRFSNKIQMHLPVNIPKCKVPKFSIQLLVENAIKHGFDSELKTLNIYISIDEKSKEIVVENDGKPMGEVEFGIGLNNLNQRLQLLCQGKVHAMNGQSPKFCISLGGCYETFNS